jgi:hypothetical protein
MDRVLPALLCLLGTAPLAAQPAPLELVPGQRSPRCTLGAAVAFVDDVNGDGRREVVVGAPSFTNVNGSPPGCAYLFDGRTGAQLFEWDGDGETSFGVAVSAAGDVTGDGVGDVAVRSRLGVQYFDGGSGALVRSVPTIGASLAFSGDLDGDGVPDMLVGEGQSGREGGAAHLVSGADGTIVQTVTSVAGFAPRELGLGVASVGDVDGDGIPDVAIGDGGTSRPGIEAIGAVHVLSGATRAHLYTVFPSAGKVHGGRFGENWTLPIAGVPDLDGDGVPDFVVGASDESVEVTTEGRVYVFSGAAGSLLYRVEGGDYVGQLGRSLAGISDVDGDGAGDFLVGEPGSGRREDDLEGPGTVRAVSGAAGDTLFVLSGPGGIGAITDNFGEATDAYVDAAGALHVVASAPGAEVGNWEEVGRGRVFLFTDVQAVASEEQPEAPGAALLSPFPNPTRTGAAVPYRIDRPGVARLTVHDVLGREMGILADGLHAAGEYRVEIPPLALPAGLYVLRLQAPSGSHTRRLVVTR